MIQIMKKISLFDYFRRCQKYPNIEFFIDYLIIIVFIKKAITNSLKVCMFLLILYRLQRTEVILSDSIMKLQFCINHCLRLHIFDKNLKELMHDFIRWYFFQKIQYLRLIEHWIVTGIYILTPIIMKHLKLTKIQIKFHHNDAHILIFNHIRFTSFIDVVWIIIVLSKFGVFKLFDCNL